MHIKKSDQYPCCGSFNPVRLAAFDRNRDLMRCGFQRTAARLEVGV
jgi:hypothetical protein